MNKVVQSDISEYGFYTIYLVCVVQELSSINHSINTINTIKDICESNKIYFKIREYNSHKYSSDRYEIEKLPAFHIYIKKAYNGTFYLDKNIENKISHYISKYLKEKNRKKWFNWF